MRNFLTLLFMLAVVVPAWAQSSRLVTPNQVRMEQKLPMKQTLMDLSANSPAVTPTDPVPVGTTVSDVVTSVKIGESSNIYSFVNGHMNQIASLPNLGSGALAFIYRQNIGSCGGQPADNGRYRYTYSFDGGSSWVTSASDTSTAANTPIGCYGLGPVNPLYSFRSRYPNIALSLPPGGTTQNDVVGIYAGPVVGSPTWDGNVAGVIGSGMSTAPTVPDEQYLATSGNQFFAYDLTERVPGEYWYASWTWDGANVGSDIVLSKGVLDTATNALTWTANTLTFNHFVFGGVTNSTALNLAFSPDGQTGYVAFSGDLVGGQDTSFSPVFVESKDGGQTWGTPFEFNMSNYFELSDFLQSFWIAIDTVSGDTVPAGTGKATTGFNLDLTVDINGNPHLAAVVGNNTQWISANNAYSIPGNYSIASGLRMLVVDFTKDTLGDWNILPITPQVTFRGGFGAGDPFDPNNSSGTIADPYLQVSRSPTGDKVFISWTDSDTTGNFGASANNNPNLFTVGYDVVNERMAPIVNWTGDDALWVSRAMWPKLAPVSLYDGVSTHTIPTVVADIGPPGTDLLLPVSYFYFTDVTYDDSDFDIPPPFFYSCSSNPFDTTNVATIQDPNCGVNDGSISLNIAGGIAPYTYQWGANAGNSDSSAVTDLGTGNYMVTVTDSFGCTIDLSFTLTNASAPVATVDSTADIACNGDNTGYASIDVAGGAGPITYLWSNGETTAAADSLPVGVNTVTITDSTGCQTTASVTINQPDAIAITTGSSSPDCFGESNGYVTADATGGTGTLSYLWNGTDAGDSLGSVPAGTYNLVVTDENGCESTEAVTLTQPDSLSATFTTSPNNSAMPPYDGILGADAVGGTPPYTYDWVGPGGLVIPNDQTPFALNGGVYHLTVTDDNGCTFMDSVRLLNVSLEDLINAGINSLNIFPNPTTGEFTLNMEMVSRNDLTIEVINISGQVVLSTRAANVTSYEETFSLSGAPAGIYLIKLSTPKGTATEKLLMR